MATRVFAIRSACKPLLFQSALKQVPRRSLFTHVHASTHNKPCGSSKSLLFPRSNKHQFRTITALTDSQVIQRPPDAEKWKRIAATTAVVLGGAGVLSFFNNRETRDALTAYEASYLNKTFSYVGAGLGIMAASAFALHRTGASYGIMRANPWLVIGTSLVASVGTMYMAMTTEPENTSAKHFWWMAFNVAQSATLSPLL